MEKDLVHFNGEILEQDFKNGSKIEKQLNNDRIIYNLNRNKLSLFFIRKICVIMDKIFFREKNENY